MKKNLVAAILMLIAGGARAATFEDLAVRASDLKGSLASESVPAVPAAVKGYISGQTSFVVGPVTPVEWKWIAGRQFTMGTDTLGEDFKDAKPVHQVWIKQFHMSKTPVTVGQYSECVIKGACSEPSTGPKCNWGRSDRETHPVNCVTWGQADQYAKFAGARLPSEAEWEFAATGEGQNQKYPWGNTDPASNTWLYGSDPDSMAKYETVPVCSRPAANTKQGLCDMVGNVSQWVQDKYQGSYTGAPSDGGAVEGDNFYRVIRGGSFGRLDSRFLRADARFYDAPNSRDGYLGFRIVK